MRSTFKSNLAMLVISHLLMFLWGLFLLLPCIFVICLDFVYLRPFSLGLHIFLSQQLFMFGTDFEEFGFSCFISCLFLCNCCSNVQKLASFRNKSDYRCIKLQKANKNLLREILGYCDEHNFKKYCHLLMGSSALFHC